MEANDSDSVADELSRRQKVRSDREKRQADGVDDNVDIDASLKGGKWKEMHMQLAASCCSPSLDETISVMQFPKKYLNVIQKSL